MSYSEDEKGYSEEDEKDDMDSTGYDLIPTQYIQRNIHQSPLAFSPRSIESLNRSFASSISDQGFISDELGYSSIEEEDEKEHSGLLQRQVSNAITKGNLQQIIEIISSMPPNRIREVIFPEHLSTAIRLGRADIVRFFIRNGINPTYYGLQNAIFAGFPEIVSILLNAGVNPNSIPSQLGELFVAASYIENDRDRYHIIESLVEFKAEDPTGVGLASLATSTAGNIDSNYDIMSLREMLSAFRTYTSQQLIRAAIGAIEVNAPRRAFEIAFFVGDDSIFDILFDSNDFVFTIDNLLTAQRYKRPDIALKIAIRIGDIKLVNAVLSTYRLGVQAVDLARFAARFGRPDIEKLILNKITYNKP